MSKNLLVYFFLSLTFLAFIKQIDAMTFTQTGLEFKLSSWLHDKDSYSKGFKKFNKHQFFKAQHSGQCQNASHFKYLSNDCIGSTESTFNKTFEKFNQKLQLLPDVNYQTINSDTYFIFNARPKYHYSSQNQQTEIVGDDIIVIFGGQTEVEIDFEWLKIGKNSSKSGNATVKGLVDQPLIAKQLQASSQFFSFTLLDYMKITVSRGLNLIDITPSDVTQNQIQELLALVNNLPNQKNTLKFALLQLTNAQYPYYLNDSVNDELNDGKFTYKWVSSSQPKRNLDINCIASLYSFDVYRASIEYSFRVKIDGYNDSKCGPQPRLKPEDQLKYGGNQQFVSKSFYQDVIKYAISKGSLDTELNRELWGTDQLQFHASDLYAIFPTLSKNYSANTEVSGKCKANFKQINFGTQNDKFNVQLDFECILTINETVTLINFLAQLNLQIQGKPSAVGIDFWLKSHAEQINYSPNLFDINQEKANQMIGKSLDRLYETKLFGSGWPLHPQKIQGRFEVGVEDSMFYDIGIKKQLVTE